VVEVLDDRKGGSAMTIIGIVAGIILIASVLMVFAQAIER
jgi:hypothetical protein